MAKYLARQTRDVALDRRANAHEGILRNHLPIHFDPGSELVALHSGVQKIGKGAEIEGKGRKLIQVESKGETREDSNGRRARR